MGAIFDFTAAQAVLKQRYTKKKLNTLEYTDNVFHAVLPKDETLGGLNHVWGVRGAISSTRSATFSSGQSSGGGSSSTYKRFVASHYNDYAFAYISGDAIESAKGDENTLIDILTGEIDGALISATRSLAIAEYKNGGGARGQISSGSNVGTATITLANVFDITNFEAGMVLQTSATDGTSGAVRAGTVTVSAVDRDAGTITASGNWTAGIAACAASDFIFMQGDFGGMMPGLAGYLPTTAPTAGDSFLSVDRSADPVRYAGLRYNGNGAPIEESLIVVAARLAREGSKPDTVLMNPEDWANLEKALSGKVIYDRVVAFDEPSIGFEAIKMRGPKGPIKILADVNCPKGTCYMLQLNTWTLMSIGKAPRIFDLDNLEMLRLNNADTYEVRCGSRTTLKCDAPGWNAVITL